jgi:hypothetical protein
MINGRLSRVVTQAVSLIQPGSCHTPLPSFCNFTDVGVLCTFGNIAAASEAGIARSSQLDSPLSGQQALQFDMARGTATGCRSPTLLPLPRGKAGRCHLLEKIIPLLPTGIGERFSQTISNLGHAALLSRCKLPL